MSVSTFCRVLVFGGRDYIDAAHVFGALDALDTRRRIDVIVHGACGLCSCLHKDCRFNEQTGADELAEQWAWARSRHIDPHPANWHPGRDLAVDRSAGPRRNAAMVRSGIAVAVRFPGGKGSEDMARRCRDHSIRLWAPPTSFRRTA